jgi:hypothetical protein
MPSEPSALYRHLFKASFSFYEFIGSALAAFLVSARRGKDKAMLTGLDK